MEIIPAIDLRGGKCVRLRQGDYAQEMIFGEDPAAMALRWVNEGAARLHLVDLDGAKAGRPVFARVADTRSHEMEADLDVMAGAWLTAWAWPGALRRRDR